MTTARAHPIWQADAARRVDRQSAVLAATAGWLLLLFVGLALLLV